jgi:hypothetical protein
MLTSVPVNKCSCTILYVRIVQLYRREKATLDSMRTLRWFVSYRGLTPQFQYSLAAAALGIYLYEMSLLSPASQFGAAT